MSYCFCLCANSVAFIILVFAPPWTVARKAPLSLEFPRQEYWSCLPFPSPGALPDPEIKLVSLEVPVLAGQFCNN